ncbi:hypothetical protein F0170_24820 [Pseudomonas sp. MAFF 730085]|uniref:Uncharacterized protein n=1 Tax=Pseudomonas kitaguniensis TaxID=2607908 RepID=A0A5N7JZY8_9PSED|nr:hypothetical protein [Pseudomonas kitaguniensis]
MTPFSVGAGLLAMGVNDYTISLNDCGAWGVFASKPAPTVGVRVHCQIPQSLRSRSVSRWFSTKSARRSMSRSRRAW